MEDQVLVDSDLVALDLGCVLQDDSVQDGRLGLLDLRFALLFEGFGHRAGRVVDLPSQEAESRFQGGGGGAGFLEVGTQELHDESAFHVLDVDLEDLEDRPLHPERGPEPVAVDLLRGVERLGHGPPLPPRASPQSTSLPLSAARQATDQVASVGGCVALPVVVQVDEDLAS